MSSGIQTLVIPTSNADAAKAVLSVLAGQPHTDEPYYVGWNVNGFEIGLNPNGHAQGLTAPLNYWQTDDIHKTIAQLLDAGATAGQPPTEVGGGTAVATVADGDGNVIGLIQRV